jgi:nucleoside phosphorylase
MRSLGEDPAATKSRALFQDLAWKVQHLDLPNKRRFMQEGLAILEDRVLESLGCTALIGGKHHDRRKFDVGIVTVLPVELKAVLAAVGGLPAESDREDYLDRPERYWFRAIQRDGKRPLSAVLTIVGRSRNVPCAIATERLLRIFPAKVMVLIGIAAGLRKKVRLGDVVGAERVIDYEHVRRELETRYAVRKGPGGRVVIGSKKTKIDNQRPLHVNLAAGIETDVGLFTPDPGTLQKVFQDEMTKFDASATVSLGKDFGPKYQKGSVVSGEKLIADGSLTDLRLRFDERLRAADQDSSGFAQACQFRDPQVPWAIFRGISDYGESDKTDDCQQAAAVVAACSAVMFLKKSYRDHTSSRKNGKLRGR